MTKIPDHWVFSPPPVCTAAWTDDDWYAYALKFNSRKVVYWPDDWWCDWAEVEQYSHRSDDHQMLYVPYDWEDSQIDEEVFRLNRYQYELSQSE
jgi:hypothetical protein